MIIDDWRIHNKTNIISEVERLVKIVTEMYDRPSSAFIWLEYVLQRRRDVRGCFNVKTHEEEQKVD
ncbi:hypothetical protein BPAE_0065g00320 [Botrytis paeoniae]|uniref:Uncharacterized protein n=1 Tax=Botrytis paeoniae TaxID=278948 RepID=A0A4Z1FNV3_9HELO|nr:hypothetical protein BPAE_0065g00320 [Botrytis paeoniae]